MLKILTLQRGDCPALSKMELTLPESSDCAFNYVSCIRINGRPILPPLMTSSRRKEMAEFRRQAAIAETRILRRKIERAHKLWEKRNDNLISSKSVDIRHSKKYGTDDNISVTYSQNCKSKGELDVSKSKLPCRNHSFPKVSNKLWWGVECSSFCDDSTHQAFINTQGFNCCDPIGYHYTATKEMPFASNNGNTKDSSSIHHSSSYVEQKNKVDDVTLLTNNTCDNGIAITGNNGIVHDKISEFNIEADTDSTLPSVEQSTDLEKYLDNSSPSVSSSLDTPSVCPLDKNSVDNKYILNCSSSSTNTTLCPSPEGSCETLVPLPWRNSDTEEKESETQVNICTGNCALNSISDDFNSTSEDHTSNTGRCHVRRSSYTLDEPSPALMLAMEDSNQDALDLSDVSDSNPVNSEECNKNVSSVAVVQNQESRFVDSPSLQNSQLIQNNLHVEFADISNTISACSLRDKQNNELSEIVKCESKKRSEDEKSSGLEQTGIMLTMKETMEKLFKEQEKSFESARKRLSDLHQQQMVKLLACQNQQWQQLLEEEANEEYEQYAHQSPIYEFSNPRNCTNVNNIMDSNRNIPVENIINEDGKIKTSLPEIRIENLSEDVSDDIKSSDKLMKAKAISPEMQLKFNKVSAAAKGYLTRRLMKSERVQRIIQTIKDTLICAMRFHQETPIKKGRVTEKDAELHKRLITQLTAACYELHDVFFKLTVKEKMEIIRQTREKMKRSSAGLSDTLHSGKCLSNATLKVLERKKLNKSPTVSNSIEDKKYPAKYCFKALRSSENTSSILKLPSRRGNVPSAHSSHSPPVRKYARQTSPKQDFQKVTRKTTPARKRLLDNNMNQKR